MSIEILSSKTKVSSLEDGIIFNYNAINKSLSTMTFTNIVAGIYNAIRFFNFSAKSNITAVHINITVPQNEVPGNKNSTILIEAAYGGYI